MLYINKVDYIKGINEIVHDKHKFKNPTINREGNLQRFLRSLINKGKIDENKKKSVYPSGLQPVLIYDLTKMPKRTFPNEAPPFRPTVSSINTNNHRLAKYLCNPFNLIYLELILFLTLVLLSKDRSFC